MRRDNCAKMMKFDGVGYLIENFRFPLICCDLRGGVWRKGIADCPFSISFLYDDNGRRTPPKRRQTDYNKGWCNRGVRRRQTHPMIVL